MWRFFLEKQIVSVIGLGYVGLPLACLCAEKNFQVMGIDISVEKVSLVSKGVSPIKDESVSGKIKKLVESKRIAASDDFFKVKNASVVVVCVPTPVDSKKLPDLKPLEDACDGIAKFLQKKQLIVIESTIYPGTIEEVVKPILEKGGLIAGKDFFLCHCPERIDPGNKKWGVENIPRVLGGINNESAEKGKEFYENLGIKVKVLKDVKAVEAVKVTENCFRDVNIAFVNELAKSFKVLGIDVKEVIEGASTKPFGYMPFFPGPGVGGHCISVDPYYLIEKAKQNGFDHKFLLLAREINNSMPFFVVQLVQEALNEIGLPVNNAKIAVLGVAYKKNVDDCRESPSFEIIADLKKKGAVVRVFDPFVPKHSTVNLLDDALIGADCAVIATDHDEFIKRLSPGFLKEMKVKAIVDARNCLKENFADIGINYKGVGK